jgi:hypothetical protein
LRPPRGLSRVPSGGVFIVRRTLIVRRHGAKSLPSPRQIRQETCVGCSGSGNETEMVNRTKTCGGRVPGAEALAAGTRLNRRRLRICAQPQSRVHRRRPTGSQMQAPRTPLPTAQRGPTAHGAVGRRCLALAVCGVGASRRRQAQQNASYLRAPRLGWGRQVPYLRLAKPPSLSPKSLCPGADGRYLWLQAHTVRYRERT